MGFDTITHHYISLTDNTQKCLPLNHSAARANVSFMQKKQPLSSLIKNLFFFLILLFSCPLVSPVRAGITHLLPKPQQLKANSQQFNIGNICISTPVLQAEWEDFIREVGGKVNPRAKQKIEVRLINSLPGVTLNVDEAYRLEVTNNKITVEAVSQKGVYWVIQTLRQLKNRNGKKSLFRRLFDYGLAVVPHRGFLQDVGRSYISLPELKKEIAILSRYKINVFHWHLTENQAWRLESKYIRH